jgi:hypothetical protein
LLEINSYDKTACEISGCRISYLKIFKSLKLQIPSQVEHSEGMVAVLPKLGWAGGASGPPIFGRSVNLVSTRGSRFFLPFTTLAPPASLGWYPYQGDNLPTIK